MGEKRRFAVELKGSIEVEAESEEEAIDKTRRLIWEVPQVVIMHTRVEVLDREEL